MKNAQSVSQSVSQSNFLPGASMSYQATLEDLAAKRRAMGDVIVALARIAGVDAAPYLDGHVAAAAAVPAEDTKRTRKTPSATRGKKGTKRAERPTKNAGSDLRDQILAALKKKGEPMAPREVAKALGRKDLQYPLRQLIDAGQVIASGKTMGRRLELP